MALRAETGKTVEQAGERPEDSVLRTVRPFAHFPGWMVAVRDTRRLAGALAAGVREFRTGGWQLKDCGVSHIRYKNGVLTALYKLTVRKPGMAADVIIDLQGKIFPPEKFANPSPQVEGSLGADGWRAVLPALDLEMEPRQPDVPLAALGFLTHPEKSRRFLEDVLRAHYPDIRIQASSPKVVRYNMGDRCTVVYHLTYGLSPGGRASSERASAGTPAGEGAGQYPEMVVAKTYHGNAGKNAFDSMSALWNSSLGASPVVRIAEPLAYLPEYHVLIQGPVREEKTLEALLAATVKYRSPRLVEEFNHAMRLTAQGLAALHTSGVRLGRVWSWKDQLNIARNEVDHLAVVLPELRAAAAPLLERLDQLAAQIPPDPLVPSHGTFRTPQVLLYQGEIGFIDFDSFRQSEPADDLALFLGEMLNFGLTPQDAEVRQARRPLDETIFEEHFDFLMAAHDRFLADYRQVHPVSFQRVVLWEALDMFLFVLHDWVKVKPGDLESTVELLQRFLKKI